MVFSTLLLYFLFLLLSSARISSGEAQSSYQHSVVNGTGGQQGRSEHNGPHSSNNETDGHNHTDGQNHTDVHSGSPVNTTQTHQQEAHNNTTSHGAKGDSTNGGQHQQHGGKSDGGKNAFGHGQGKHMHSNVTYNFSIPYPSQQECAEYTRQTELDHQYYKSSGFNSQFCNYPNATRNHLAAKVCNMTSPREMAFQQFDLDAHIQKCRNNGYPDTTAAPLDLPPPAMFVVWQFYKGISTLRREQTAFLVLQILGGHVGLVFILGVSLFARFINYEATFVNFCITWIVSSISFSVFLYNGSAQANAAQTKVDSDTWNLCLSQAALINGVQVMTGASTAALVIHLWLKLRPALQGKVQKRPIERKAWVNWILLSTPYLLFLIASLPSIFVRNPPSKHDGQSLLPITFYCASSLLNTKVFYFPTNAVNFILLFITLIFDFMVIHLLYRHWKVFRYVHDVDTVPLSALARVLAFTIFRVVTAAADLIILISAPNVATFLQSRHKASAVIMFGIPTWADLLQATTPLVATLLFGTTREMLRVFLFWRRSSQTAPANDTSPEGISSDEFFRGQVSPIHSESEIDHDEKKVPYGF